MLVDQLRIHGCDMAFCVPGESYLDVLDALYDTPAIKLIVARQEGGAAFMSEAYGKITGKPGICFVTRGPGASNASIGVHTAFHDCTPMILFIGQVARAFTEREGFQEIDFRRMFAPISKWATQIDDPARIPEILARAFATAVSGRPGPVVIALPEDMLAEAVSAADALPFRRAQGSPSSEQIEDLRALLAAAERPLLIVGGGDWSAQAAADMRVAVRANGLPVLASFRAQDIIDNRMPEYIGALGVGGNPALRERVRQADVIVCVGDRLSELPMDDYQLLRVPTPAQTLVHVFPGPDELGRVYQARLPIVSGMPEFAAAMRAMPAVAGARWHAWLADGRAAYERYTQPAPAVDAMDVGAIITHLRERLPADTMITNGAGNYTGLVHRYSQFTAYRTQVAPVNGTMGYGVPAAVACKLLHPERVVVAFAGDGCFLMNGQELATAMQYQLPILIVVINNGKLGTIRMHQERRFPGRVMGSDLVNPDFAALARAFGAHGECVTRTADFPAALERALGAGRAALIEIISPT